ncbi:MAG TPA: hypothetical protein VD948_09415 [Rhodothermales bacterium]|nr:hypothetical protein [Rhodothermales bacterium]
MPRSPLLLAALVLLPVAARAQTAPVTPATAEATGLPADSLVGSWSYSVETPDGAFTGRLIVEKAQDGTLTARLTGDAGGGQSLPVQRFAFDGRSLTGTFSNPAYGEIGINVSVTGRAFSGEFIALAMGASVPTSGRKL